MALQDGEPVERPCVHPVLTVVETVNHSTFPQYDSDLSWDTLECDNCHAKWQEIGKSQYFRIGKKYTTQQLISMALTSLVTNDDEKPSL